MSKKPKNKIPVMGEIDNITGKDSDAHTIGRVFLDPASPTFASIARIVLILLLILILTAVAAVALYQLSFLLFLIVLSVFVAYLLDPLVSLIRRPFKVRNIEQYMPRSLAILFSYLIVFGVLGIAIAYLAPIIGTQVRDFAESLPRYATAIQAQLASLNSRYEQLAISEDVQMQINSQIALLLGDFGSRLTAFAGNTAIELIAYLPWLLLIPIFVFFFLKDGSEYRKLFLRFFSPGQWRARAESFVTDVNTTLAAYTRAQLLSCLLIGFICTIGFTLLGLEYALLLGIIAGVLEFIPLLGPIVIGVTATLVGTFSDDPIQGLWTAIFLLALRLVHDYVTYPRIVRGGIHLQPLAVILSVLAGEQIAGIPGVFLSIPIVALLTVLYKHIARDSHEGIFAGIFSKEKREVIRETDQ